MAGGSCGARPATPCRARRRCSIMGSSTVPPCSSAGSTQTAGTPSTTTSRMRSPKPSRRLRGVAGRRRPSRALGAAGLFAVIACLSLLSVGPPWAAVAVTLGVVAAIALPAAGVLARIARDSGTALVAGLLSVAAGAAAVTVSAAGSVPLAQVGAAPLLFGTLSAMLLAVAAALAMGTRRAPFAAISTGALLGSVTAACCLVFGLSPAGGAAVLAGLAMVLMPAIPAAALWLAGLEVNRLPATSEDIQAERETVDGPAVALRTRRAIGYLTALVNGLAWPAFGACVLLAFSHDVTAEVLTAVVGFGLVLRARLFRAVGQRLPLLIAGIAAIAVLLVALTLQLDASTSLVAVVVPALLGVALCLTLAGRHRRRFPSQARIAEISELGLAIAVVPLVAGVLGLFGFVRGLGG